MPRAQQLSALVLQAHNVGEADRFCILLTKERGKIAARARGVRKPKSRMGGSLLPLRTTTITVQEGSAGFFITGAASQDADATPLAGFLQMQHVCEILLSVLEDDHPVPEIYELTTQFLTICKTEPEPRILPFTIRLLCFLGVMPQEGQHQLYAHLSEAERRFINECSAPHWQHIKPMSQQDSKHLWLLCQRIIENQSRKPLKTEAIIETMINDDVSRVA